MLWQVGGCLVFSTLLFCQAEEAAAEITKKLEKQEKKRLKKEKKRLAALALASSENSSTPEECEVSPLRTSEVV